MVIVDDNTASIRVAVDSLTPFTPLVLKAIPFKCSNELSDRGILEFGNHRETATAGSSITVSLSDGTGRASPASIISSI